ncbi:MAG: hypothetical protein IPN39_05490 [Chitinophagaceae bacterium]|nr:hypothetical protein [Chitinophagaceae bacterium]HQV54888.1 hypothetical protein [Chitinophagaceae bacterium]HQV84503.1 hypothetical protein [Chitinophagaceae bacterium]HQZ74935.1 hypothetical protein [Chitinophagaceae bacterium]
MVKFLKNITNGFLSILFIFLYSIICETSNSITLEYGWLTDKPIPKIIFYADTFNKNESWPYYAYKVNRECLKLIKNEIKGFDSVGILKDTNQVGYYNYVICTQSQKTRYITDNKKHTKKLLNKILDRINDTAVKRSVGLRFDDISRRIW